MVMLVYGCGSKKDSSSAEDLRTGTQGISIGFLANNPPPVIHADQKSFDIIIEVANTGAYPPLGFETSMGKIYLSGYDKNVLDISPAAQELNSRGLAGKSVISPTGSLALYTFKNSNIQNLNTEKYDAALLATVCYNYETIAEQSVCIDPDPYSTVQEKKVCEVKNIQLSSQGAPVAVTSIDEEALQDKTQFKITIKNVGGGDIIKNAASDKCNPYASERLNREDLDKVYLSEVKLAGKALQCKYFAEAPLEGERGYIRMINGEGSVICELSKSSYAFYQQSKAPFTTPIGIHLQYSYRATAQTGIQIKKEMAPGSSK